ncbi:hypothetical protein Dsin_022687 [Dipteronia sinensis]|uniref:RRM domain-containing protein n=1 Tax=Dipteronia sinensis TaxID=43782 RepID=A0AAE0E1D4_9ROSI|nr:hypothetical protein Dsin_022687 [Dipteronia sinensis]
MSMRERVSERNSKTIGHGGKKRAETVGHGGEKDFRDCLHSIFVDNLNPKVVEVNLWGFFKRYGRVRDVFLSSKNISRRSCFAFIRFESLEEARRVAESVNGKNVIGWTINSKVAAFGWKNGRVGAAKKFGLRVGGGGSVEDGKSIGSQQYGIRNRNNCSFAEALQVRSKKYQIGERSEEEIAFLLWDIKSGEDNWLDKCVVGELKQFSSVSKSFPVRLHEDPTPMDFKWLAIVLGLKLSWSADNDSADSPTLKMVCKLSSFGYEDNALKERIENRAGLKDGLMNLKETLSEDGLKKCPLDEIVEGQLKGQTEPSLSGKKDMILDIIERKYYSRELERNSTMLRSTSVHDKVQHQIRVVKNKVGWSLDEEIVKVLERGMALGFEFNGKKKELLEIINSRKKENDTRFHDLVRNLVQKHKPSGS